MASVVQAHTGHESTVEHPVLHSHGGAEIVSAVAVIVLLLSVPRLRRWLSQRM